MAYLRQALGRVRCAWRCWRGAPHDAAWRSRVTRLAVAFGGDEVASDFAERRCDICGRRHMTNIRIYPPSAPFRCGDSLYAPDQRRDGYWFATALTGHDPDAPVGTAISPERARELREICRRENLVFWSNIDSHVRP